MSFELDHFILFVRDPEPATETLADFGLRVGYADSQPGTGTGHTVFFFDNTYLEFVWPEPSQVPFADAPAMHVEERLSPTSGWCPLGVSFRPTSHPSSTPPLRTWDYSAPFLPDGATPIPIAANSENPGEPLIIVSLFSGRPDERDNVPPLQRDVGFHDVCSIALSVGSLAPGSPELAALPGLFPSTLEFGCDFGLELRFNAGPCTDTHDFQPTLPLIISW